MSADVYIAGIACSPVGELWDRSLRQLATEVLTEAREDSGGLKPDGIYVASMLAGSASHQSNLGALVAEYAGLSGYAGGLTVASAEASGGAALHLAYIAVRSGFVDVAAVVGVEKPTDSIGASLEAMIARSLDADSELSEGLTPVGQAALLMRRYLHEYHVPREALASFPILAHQNAVNNPKAMYRKAITQSAYLRAGMIADPLNLYDVAPVADGAACLILTRKELLKPGFAEKAVLVASSSFVTTRLALHDRPDPLFFEAAAVSVENALNKAEVTREELDFFEYSDNSSLHALLSLEAGGFAPRGQAWNLARQGKFFHGGGLPVATLGGHKARGFPLGASGVYQAVEASLQLRGEAGAGQIPNARIGMIQSLAGTGSAAATHILHRG